MSRIVCGLERALVSTLEAIVLLRAHGRVESFARDILQTAATKPIQSWPAQGFAVAAPMTGAQSAILPKLAGRAETIGRMNISRVATSPDRAHAVRRAQQFDFGKGLGGVQHQQFRFRL